MPKTEAKSNRVEYILSSLAFVSIIALLAGCTALPPRFVKFPNGVVCERPLESEKITVGISASVGYKATELIKAKGGYSHKIEALSKLPMDFKQLRIALYRLCRDYGNNILKREEYLRWRRYLECKYSKKEKNCAALFKGGAFGGVSSHGGSQYCPGWISASGFAKGVSGWGFYSVGTESDNDDFTLRRKSADASARANIMKMIRSHVQEKLEQIKSRTKSREGISFRTTLDFMLKNAAQMTIMGVQIVRRCLDKKTKVQYSLAFIPRSVFVGNVMALKGVKNAIKDKLTKYLNGVMKKL